MAAKTETAFASHAVTQGGIVVAATPWGIAQGDPQETADHLAPWAAEPGQILHVWANGGVQATIGGTLADLPTPDAEVAR
jgi:hypothetical protein